VPISGRALSRAEQGALASNLPKLHAGFGSSAGNITPSIVVHRFGPESDYQLFRAKLLDIEGPEFVASAKHRSKNSSFFENITHGNLVLRRTQRNTPALWGAGLIDAIPAPVIEELAARQAKEHSTISGRPARTSGGGIGKFGWRGQIETLRDFVLAACANELGLQTSGHAQAVNPLAAHYKAHLTDITSDDVGALVAFVADLPKPMVREPHNPFEQESMKIGVRLFDRIGCSACHVRQVGAVDGLFSDLLLHDMGEGLEDPAAATPAVRRKTAPSVMGTGGWAGGPSDLFDQESRTPELAREWRTPPLWGLAQSAPYLHDGRAATVSEAILMHGGEAASSVEAFKGATTEERTALTFFLKSLVSPSPHE
jgi:CxxC motif-containing protein (DUF1111 family)